MPDVFISYRRLDSAASAGHVFDRLRDYFGDDHVFRDLDTLAPGAEFATVIRDRIGACDALIAVIGKNWLTLADSNGRRRLDDPSDYVAAEIREALERQKLVIPALVDGAQMPTASDLPGPIAALAGRNAIDISESRFDHDTDRLIQVVEGCAAGESGLSSWTARCGTLWRHIIHSARSRLGAATVVVTAVILSVGWLLDHRSSAHKFEKVTTQVVADLYERQLQQTRQELFRAMADSQQQSRDRIVELQNEIEVLQVKLANPDATRNEFRERLASQDASLVKAEVSLPRNDTREARDALQRGDLSKAKQLWTEAYEGNRVERAQAAFQLAELAHLEVNYAEARKYYAEAVRLQPDNPEYLNMAGLAARESGRYAEARPYLEKALAIRRQTPGVDPAALATSLNNLAVLYKSQGRYADAEPLYQEALTLRQQAPAPNPAEVAGSLNNLAELYYRQGRYAKAEPLYQQALAIQRKALGAGHTDLAISLNNLAELYRSQQLFAKAEPLYREALTIEVKSLGPNHPLVAMTRNNLALLYHAQNLCNKAEPLYIQALDSLRQLPEEHADLPTVMANYADCLARMNRHEEAKQWQTQADALRQKHAGAAKAG